MSQAKRSRLEGHRTDPPADLERRFLEHLPRIERAASSVARRAGFQPQEVEDFVSTVKVKLIDDDYAVLRKHRGDSSLGTFLVTVVHNLFKDHLNHRFGKFRPSQAARNGGPVALALERLLVIDQHDTEAAIEILKRNHGVEDSRQALRALAATLPARSPRRLVGDEALEQRPSDSSDDSPEQRVIDGEQEAAAASVGQALTRALATLDPQDVLILKMSYRDGCKLSTVARSLRLVQRSLYSRRDRCFRALRRALEAEGVGWDDVQELLRWPGAAIRVDFGSTQNHQPGPSNR